LRSIYSRPFQTKPKKTQFNTSLSYREESQAEYQKSNEALQTKSSQVDKQQPKPEQLLEYDRLVQVFIKE